VAVRIIDVTEGEGFGLIPPCADPGFDHRSCDYWEDADRGSKAARLSWFDPSAVEPAVPPKPSNPFGGAGESAFNPFAPSGSKAPAFNPFATDDDAEVDNPFAPKPKARPGAPSDAPRKLQLLDRGLAVFGSYAKVLVLDDVPSAYAQFGPLSAYPRALRVRELYPRLPVSPLPAVITCIATTKEARGQGLAKTLVSAVCDDLAGRGFSAVEAYPEPGLRPDGTSAASPPFWVDCGFAVVVDDERFPVVRREL
jgi:GNAT superfamily N-acetyltransferase